jgi:putative transposase
MLSTGATDSDSAPACLPRLSHAERHGLESRTRSADIFRCESLTLRTHWVMVVMDQFTRRIIGFSVHGGIVDGPALCQMFQKAIRQHSVPKYLSTDNDPLYRFHQWQANLRVREVIEVKTVPGVPLSHPFVERLIGTIRRECLDQTLFWTTADLEAKLRDFRHYFNGYRTHAGLGGRLPEPGVEAATSPINLAFHRWQKHCHGLYKTPVAPRF